MTEVIILDENGEAWTPERFRTESDAAQNFLTQIEQNSYRLLDDWRDFSNDELVVEAQYRLMGLQKDLTVAEFMKQKGILN